MNVAVRLGVNFGLVLAVVLAMAGLVMWQLVALEGSSSEAARRAQDLRRIQDAAGAPVVAYRVAADLVINRDPVAFATQWKEQAADLDAKAAAVRDLADTAEEKALAGDLARRFAELQALIGTDMAGACARIPAGTLTPEIVAVDGRIDAAVNACMALTDRLARSLAAEQEATARVAEQAFRSAIWVIGIGLAAALAAAALLAWSTIRALVPPLRQAVDGLDRLAGGDLAHRLPAHGRDEVGRMGGAFNRTAAGIAATLGAERVDWQRVAEQRQAAERLTAGLKQVLDAVRRDSARLAASADELHQVAGGLQEQARTATGQAASVSSAAEQVSSSVATVAAGAEEMQSSIAEVSRNSGTAAKRAEEMAADAARSDQAVARLGEASQQIGQVVKTISAIAEQTNLLALNATIEAARAGEAGKGFAVVAGEVKELAKQSAAATEDIGKRILAIQQETAQTVESIRRISGAVGEVKDLQNSVASAIEEQAATTAEMSRTVGEAARGAAEIAQAIAGVAAAAQATDQAAQRANAAADAIAALARGLEDELRRQQ